MQARSPTAPWSCPPRLLRGRSPPAVRSADDDASDSASPPCRQTSAGRAAPTRASVAPDAHALPRSPGQTWDRYSIMGAMWFDQTDYDVRLEWGRAGLEALLGVSDAMVIVDV